MARMNETARVQLEFAAWAGTLEPVVFHHVLDQLDRRDPLVTRHQRECPDCRLCRLRSIGTSGSKRIGTQWWSTGSEPA